MIKSSSNKNLEIFITEVVFSTGESTKQISYEEVGLPSDAKVLNIQCGISSNDGNTFPVIQAYPMSNTIYILLGLNNNSYVVKNTLGAYVVIIYKL
ncbi:hypothetical protein [uncultured Fusobacterium sp.]|uniref:hypothetical protein n=1 Tax=uncultured Fusobacterium sp. TaxID=159267 RepID=UPI0025ED0CFF|nr:hypothetical protein [uncultured Fusobacterium sp.]